MKKNFLRYTMYGFLALSLTTACTDDFESLNTNKHAATEADMEKDGKAVGSFFTQMINRTTVMKIGGDQDDEFASTGAYQHQIGISADSYSGYIGHTAGWARGRYNGTYNFSKGNEWGNAMFKMGMVQIMPAWAQMRTKALEQNQPQVAALADVVKVFAMHRVADHYGPIPYVNYKLGAIGQTYDALDKVYAKFFEELDAAIETLTPYALAGNNILGDYDPIFGGDVMKWTKMANTLRLRLALRVVYADAALAQAEAEKSAASPVGFIEEADSRVQYNGLPNAAAVNPIWQQAYEWNENRMSAPMDSYLNGYKDPRLSVYFVAAADGKYHGVRQGVFADGANQSAYIGEKISNVNLSENSPVLYMAAAESFFLRAEAALRGWNMGGTAKSFYESGIKASMQENGISSGVDTAADAVLLHGSLDSRLIEALGSSTHIPTAQGSLCTQEEALGSSHVEYGRVLAEVDVGDLLTDVRTLVGTIGKHALAHTMVLAIGGSHEVDRKTRILITVEVGIHRSAHAVLVPFISLLPDGVDGSCVGQTVILHAAVSLLDEAYRTCSRLLGLSLSQSSISIDHTQGQTQTQGVGHLGPLHHVATEDGVVVTEDVVACEGIGSECLDGGVEFLKELGIHLVECIVSLTNGTEFVIHVRNGAIMVGHTVHGKHLHDIGQCCHLGLILFQGLCAHLCPSRHDLHHAHLEHGVTPFVAFREIVGTVVATASPAGRVADVAGIAVGADANLVLVGTRGSEFIVLVAANLHHRRAVDHLCEEGTYGLAILLHVGFSSSVLVGVQALEVVGASRGERESQEAIHCISQKILFHFVFSFPSFRI